MKIIIEGKPIAKKRPRFVRRGKFVTTYSAQKEEEATVKAIIAAQVNKMLEGAIEVDIIFWMPIPKATTKKMRATMYYHTKKPDIDNLAKFYMDCMNGIVWNDDAQVVCLTATKYYSEYPNVAIEAMEVT
jgi:Holliday junction resolvase RusA-like endonuclease